MARQALSKYLDSILRIVEGSSAKEGVSFEDIFKSLVPSPPRRSLQRYLALLVAQGHLRALGNTRARLYLLGDVQEVKSVSVEATISLSPEALSIQAHINRPIQARTPVGYKREFLDRYRPNETFYLSESMRKHLRQKGAAPDPMRPAGTYARQIFNRLLIDLSWNSSRLEGNTYSLLETERLLALGEVSEGKDTTEAQMILNHKAAIEYLVESAEQINFNRFTIFNLHALLADNLLKDPSACGSLRTQAVGIGGSVYQPLSIPQLIDEYFQQILDTAQVIEDPFEQAFFVMVQLPYLQPFLDVNKRVSRLAANIPLIRGNLSPLSFVDVPEQLYVNGLLGVYELNRIELFREVFIWAYERSSALYLATRQELGEPDPFRLRYRTQIAVLVGEIVRAGLDKSGAVAVIRKRAQEVIERVDQAKFIEMVEKELMNLHQGNIARFKLRPSEYTAWYATWR